MANGLAIRLMVAATFAVSASACGDLTADEVAQECVDNWNRGERPVPHDAAISDALVDPLTISMGEGHEECYIALLSAEKTRCWRFYVVLKEQDWQVLNCMTTAFGEPFGYRASVADDYELTLVEPAKPAQTD